MADWLTADEEQAWTGLVQLTGELRGELNRQLQREHGVSISDYEVLARLADAPDGRLRARDLEVAMGWEQSRLSHHLARMQRRGLVRRQACETDRRGVVMALTDRGRHTLEQAAPSHVATVRRVFLDALSPRQVRQLGIITAAALRHLRDEE